MLRYAYISLLLVGLIFSFSAYGDKKDTKTPISIAYIGNAYHKGFWKNTRIFMEQVAKDLNIDIRIHSAGGHQEAYRAIQHIAQSDDKPDYAIFPLYFHSRERILSVAQEHGISTFIFNSNFRSAHQGKVGSPREKFPLWLGHMFPDDYAIGQQMAEILVNEQQRRAGNKQPIALIGLGGTSRSSPGVLRKQGLLDLAHKTKAIDIKRVIRSEWLIEDAQRSITELLHHYPDTQAIWTAGGSLAEGALAAIKQHELIPGDDILVGTIDLSPAVLSKIDANEIHVAFGGHFMEAGWSLILLHDHYHGIDFKDDLGTRIHLPHTMISKENAAKYTEILTRENWAKIDFKKFSKVYTPSLSTYDFSIVHLEKVYQASKKQLAQLADSDNDNIPDIDDKCPRTKKNTRVNDLGCDIAPQRGTFGVYTEKSPTDNAFTFGQNADHPIWEYTLSECTTKPFEGKESICWNFKKGAWFGAGIKALQPLDFTSFNTKDAYLRFKFNIPAHLSFKIGILDFHENASWVLFPANTPAYNAKRTGDWEEAIIPIQSLLDDYIDMDSMAYLFTVLSDADAPPTQPFTMLFDDIVWVEGKGK